MEIKVDYADSLELERLQYEVSARQSLLAYLIQSDIDQNNEKFNKYHKEYLDFFKEYEKRKRKLTDKYLKDYKDTSWSLDFDTQTLTIK